MTGISTHILVALAVLGGSAGLFVFNETAAVEHAESRTTQTLGLPIWQVSHPVFGNCALSTKPDTAISKINLSDSCRNAFQELAAAKYWSLDVADEIVLLNDKHEKILAFSSDESGIFEVMKPSTSQLQLIPPQA